MAGEIADDDIVLADHPGIAQFLRHRHGSGRRRLGENAGEIAG